MASDQPDWAAAARRVARPDWEGFARQLERNGGCVRPVRLRGSITSVDRATGEAQLVFSSTAFPGAVLLKACGCRRATRCPACSAVYKGDARVIVLAGLAGGKGVDPSVAERPAVFMTLTAPSFGAVHGLGRPCRTGSGSCRHGVARACGQSHEPGEDIVGSALCPDCYDYEGAVIWNARVSELWRRTGIAAFRQLAAQTDLPVRAAAKVLRMSFVRVVEFQRRGLVHVHAVMRVDAEEGADPGVIDLLAALGASVGAVEAPNPWRASQAIRWGAEHDLVPLSGGEHRKVAAYLAKYATKSTDDAGVLDRRLSEGSLEALVLPDHLRRMVETAWALGRQPSLADLRLQAWAHTLGFRGHWVTKSRKWSTTFGRLRAERYAWREARELGSAEVDDQRSEVLEIADWTYAGVGYADVGELLLAASRAATRSRERRTGWEER